MSQFRKLATLIRRALWCSALSLIAPASRAVAQGDTVPVGPPPHFVAFGPTPGTLIDVSRTATLQSRVTLNLVNVPIDTAITVIVNRANLKLLYRMDYLPSGQTVSLHATNMTAASALTEVLRNTGLDVLMGQEGNFYLIKCPHLSAQAVGRDSGVVTGQVIDQVTNVPLSGAVVVVVGTQLSATTNAEGQYRLRAD